MPQVWPKGKKKKKKATMNLRMVDGAPVYDGDQIQIGDQEYISVCRYHYTNPVIKVTKKNKEKEV